MLVKEWISWFIVREQGDAVPGTGAGSLAIPILAAEIRVMDTEAYLYPQYALGRGRLA